MCSSFKGVAVFVLVLVNFLFAAAGLLMLAFGIAARATPETIIKLLSYSGDLSEKASHAGFDLAGIIQSSSVFLIILGAVVAVVGLFGCIGACCNVKWMLSVYIIILIIILLAEVAIIIFGALYPEKFKSETQPLMLKSLREKFKSDVTFNSSETFVLPLSEVELAWTSMQFELGCCGANGTQDYMTINFTRAIAGATVPVSCCKLKDGPGIIPTSKDQFYDFNDCQSRSPQATSLNEMNCYTAVELMVKGYGRIAIGIAAAIIGIEIILILLTVWVCRSIGIDRSKGV